MGARTLKVHGMASKGRQAGNGRICTAGLKLTSMSSTLQANPFAQRHEQLGHVASHRGFDFTLVGFVRNAEKVEQVRSLSTFAAPVAGALLQFLRNMVQHDVA